MGLLNRAEFGSVRRAFCVALGSVERKGYCISVTIFLYFNSKVCKRLPKKLSMEKKNHNNVNFFCQTALFSSKTATESLKPCTAFDFQSYA